MKNLIFRGLQFWIGFTQKISQHTICVVDGMWMLKNLTDGLMKSAQIEYLDKSFNPDKVVTESETKEDTKETEQK